MFGQARVLRRVSSPLGITPPPVTSFTVGVSLATGPSTPGQNLAYQQSLAAAWVRFNGTAGSASVIQQGYNIAATVRNAQGNFTVKFNRVFANTNYVCVGSCQLSSGVQNYTFSPKVFAASAVTFYTVITNTDAVADCDRISVVCYGLQ